MSTQVPVVQQFSWRSSIPQLMALLASIVIGMRIDPHRGMIWGSAVYLAYSFTSRLLATRQHRGGIRLMRQQKFADAIPYFQRSLDFFDRHPWVDRFRSIVLMSPSATSYREMALANIAFCYTQMGEGKQARQFYEKCLERYPHSGLAVASLRFMDSAEQAART